MSIDTNMEIATALNSAITHLSRRIRRIDDRQQIGRARLSALSVLVFGGPRTLGQLAVEEQVSAVTMHHVVNGLVASKLASTRADKNDGRKVVVHATRAGKRFMDEARQARLDFYTEHLERLSAEERDAVVTFARLAKVWVWGEADATTEDEIV
jgi:DNA-binding MarR family transcriptional regulator